MKTDVDDLAILGGPVAFKDTMHVGQPNIGDKMAFMQRVDKIFDSRWLTNNGPCVRELEAKIADFLGVEHCVLVCNATTGLSVAARALGLSGEVIMPSLTFVATAHALEWQGIKPVFCDVDEATHLIDPEAAEALITPRTTGIMGVHLWGRVCDADRLQAVADRHDLVLAFDAAHAFGCSAEGRMVGTLGAAEVFSFHATKFFNTFEGGAITTNDDALAHRIRLMVNFGFAGYDDVALLGTNAKMNEVSAAMGLTSFEYMPEVLAVNERNHRLYRELLAQVPNIRMLEVPADETSNFQYVVTEYRPSEGGLTRDQLIDVLWQENVLARRYFYPGCHRLEPYRSADPSAHLRLPHTEEVADRLVILPTGTAVGLDDIESICEIINVAVRGGRDLAERL